MEIDNKKIKKYKNAEGGREGRRPQKCTTSQTIRPAEF